jgi:CMD domain protein
MRDERPEANKNAQLGFLALFAPENTDTVTREERFALAVFTALLHQTQDIAGFYTQGLTDAGASTTLVNAIRESASANPAKGPYGAYPPGPLSKENEKGPAYAVPPALAKTLGPRLAAAFNHTYMLVFHPRDSKGEHLQALLDAGWSTDGIVTISQLVTFLAYQIQLVHGLRAMQSGGAANG